MFSFVLFCVVFTRTRSSKATVVFFNLTNLTLKFNCFNTPIKLHLDHLGTTQESVPTFISEERGGERGGGEGGGGVTVRQLKPRQLKAA